MSQQVNVTIGGDTIMPSNGIGLFQAMLAAPLVGLNQRWPKVLHAVTSDEIAKRWPSGTATAVCGAKRLRILKSGPMVVEWPPSVKSLPESHERCRECHQETGKRSPRSRWVQK